MICQSYSQIAKGRGRCLFVLVAEGSISNVPHKLRRGLWTTSLRIAVLYEEIRG